MSDTNLKDAIAGASILLFGVFTTVYSFSQLPVGSLNAADAGLFPAGIGIVLIAIGSILFLQALMSMRTSTSTSTSVNELVPNWHGLTLITLSIIAFAIGFMFFGLIPAIIFSTLVASLAETKLHFRKAALLGVFLAALVAIIFRFVLGMYIPLLTNPFGG